MLEAGEIVHLDALVDVCGFFNADTETFGGHGCKHPDQESRDPETGEGQCDDCPLAWRLCPDQEERDAEIMRKAELEPENGDGKLRVMITPLARYRGLIFTVNNGGRVQSHDPVTGTEITHHLGAETCCGEFRVEDEELLFTDTLGATYAYQAGCWARRSA